MDCSWFKLIHRPKDLEEALDEKPTYPRELIDTLPNGKLKEMAIEDWENYDKYLDRAERERETAKLVQKALDSKSGELAYKVLPNNLYHDNRIELQRLEKIEQSI